MKPYIKVASEEDAILLSTNLRKEDEEEIKAYANIKPKEALILGIQQSKIPLAVYDKKGKIVFLCGVRNINSYIGKRATFTYFQRTQAGSYRHPLFKCIRNYE